VRTTTDVNALTSLTTAERADIQSRINAGATVITPTHETDLDSWQGVGYLALYTNGDEGWIIVSSAGSSHGGYAISYTTPKSIVSQPYNLDSGDPVNPSNGAVLEDATDVNIPTAGLPLTFARHYDSTMPGDPTLGQGWYGSYSDFLTFNGDGSITWT